MCGATVGGVSTEGVDLDKQAVIQGVVVADSGDEQVPVSGAYVRLLDGGGEFVAELPTSATGHFRFFAADGRWTIRALAPGRPVGERRVVAAVGQVAEVTLAL